MANSFKNLLTVFELFDYLEDAAIKEPTAIQSKAIPAILKHQDVVAFAPTGTGKTLAYALPIFELVKRNEERRGVNTMRGCPSVIVLTPTRELARQVFKVFKSISHFAKCRVRLFVSGESVEKNMSSVREPLEILITVPGKLVQGLKRNELSGDMVEAVVIDEADQTIDTTFEKDLTEIIHKLPNEAKYLLFSATEPDNFDELKNKIFGERSFESIVIKGTHKVVPTIETFNIFLPYKDKQKMVVEFLKKQKGGQGIIFTNQKEDAIALFEFLQNEFPKRKIALLHGKMTPRERKLAYRKVVEEGSMLVCTDIAARGLDVDGLAWVLNYDLPFDAVYYIHRVGRTGRKGRPGAAYNFVTAKDDKLIAKINEVIVTQDTLKIKPLENLKPKKKTVRKAVPKAKTVAQIRKEELGKLEEKRSKSYVQKTKKRSPRFARRKKA